MLRGVEKLITYIILVVVFVFGIVFLTRQIGLTSDLKHSLSQVKSAGIQSGDLNNIAQLHSSSAKVFFLTFFALCILLIGTIIVIRGIERAYDISEVKEKVRLHLKSTTPGVVMVVLASFLLAFCSYKTSNIEAMYSSRLVDYNNYKIAMHGWNEPVRSTTQLVRVDSSMVKRLRDTSKRVAVDVPDVQKKVDPKFAKPQKPALVPVPVPARTTPVVAGKGAKAPVAQPAAPPAKPAKTQAGPDKTKLVITKPVAPAVKPQAAPAQKTAANQKPAVNLKPATVAKPAVSQKSAQVQQPTATAKLPVSKKPVASVRSADTKKHTSVAKSATQAKQSAATAGISQKKAVVKKPVAADRKAETTKLAVKKPAKAVDKEKATPPVADRPLTREDIVWAQQFQRNVTVYGYHATRGEEARYDRVRRYNEKANGNMIDSDLNWAYTFLQKTKRGYEPKPGELRRYEEIIQRNVNTSASTSGRRQQL